MSQGMGSVFSFFCITNFQHMRNICVFNMSVEIQDSGKYFEWALVLLDHALPYNFIINSVQGYIK